MAINMLLVDDHMMVIDALKTMIELQQAFVVKATAYNGSEALSILREGLEIDIVITDIKMEPLDGIALCKIIKKEFKDLKVLILTMYDDANMVNLALEAEADGYLLKNAGKEELFKALHSISNDGYYYDHNIHAVILEKEGNDKSQHQKPTLDLTPREMEILKLIYKEYTSIQISKKLFISKKTVDNHRTHILNKTGCKTTIGLVKYALKLGL